MLFLKNWWQTPILQNDEEYFGGRRDYVLFEEEEGHKTHRHELNSSQKIGV